MPKRVLIITYYWPPSGGAGVQRWLKFAKYLPENGWDPVIYTPENAEMPSTDLSLLKDVPENTEVIKTPIWEPYDIYKKFIGQKKEEKINAGFLSESKKPKKTEKIAVWIRGNFFVPDARKYWVKPSVKYLLDYLKQNPVDAIISTGPPHSMHLIALQLKRRLKLKWIADFRDPWTNIDFYQELMLTNMADKKHKRLEKEVLTEADVVLTVGNTLARELTSLGATNVEVITNGYDNEEEATVELDEKFSISHIGSMTKTRNPEALWQAIGELINENTAFKEKLEIKLVGKVDISVMESLKTHGLDSFVRKIDYLPHNDVILEQKKSHILLLVVNDTPNAKGIVTGKVFEYLSSGRPILCIGPEDGDVAEILKEAEKGTVCHYQNVKGIKSFLLSSLEGKSVKHNQDKIVKFSRKMLTKELARILNNF